ncbi:MAG: hypothetical protein JWQ82_199 [Tardiphaga sp.]|nr:hypothetical protein [Tardiphaga sp.]
MDAATTFIPGLGDVLASGNPERKTRAIRQIGKLFAQGAPHFGAAHVALFDDVLTGLISQSDPAARAELAAQMAPLANAPPRLVGRLVHDNLIAISGPLLGRSTVVDDPTLIEIARMKGQPHLLAISRRPVLTPLVTDVIVRRGERDVVRAVAANSGAEFSQAGYSSLIRRAGDDGPLALAVGQRGDLSDAHLKDLLAGSVEIVRRRLLANLPAPRHQAIGLTAPTAPAASLRRDFVPAQKAILALHRVGRLNENAVMDAAARGDYETVVAALSALSGTQIATIDQLLRGERHDPVLVLGRAIGLDWSTVCAVIAMRPGQTRALSARVAADARLHYERLLRATAQRAVGFWRLRQPDVAADDAVYV